METVTTLDDKVRAFKVLLDKKDELAEQTKANNEELKNLEQEIAQQMVDEEKPDTTVDGFKYSLQEKTRYSKISEEKLMEKGLVFFDVLREQGFGHLITERVDPRTLDSAMNNLAAENDGELPEEMAEVLSVYSELKVSKRKANTKALNRAKKAQEVSRWITNRWKLISHWKVTVTLKRICRRLPSSHWGRLWSISTRPR